MQESIAAVAKRFQKTKGFVEVYSHFDTDGICSAALMIVALQKLERPFRLRLLPQLRLDIIEQLKGEANRVFLDLGATKLQNLKELKGETFVLDHHAGDKDVPENLNVVNPHLHGIDGGREITAAGITYLFGRALGGLTSTSLYLVLASMVGDGQLEKSRDALSQFNRQFLEDAEKARAVEVLESIRLEGVHAKPLYKALAETKNFEIPGITGDHTAAGSLLDDLHLDGGINLGQLEEEELKKLREAIIAKRQAKGLHDAGDTDMIHVFLPYNLSFLKDAKEFSTVLNACGRLNRGGTGVGICLQDPVAIAEAKPVIEQYRKLLQKAFTWYEEKGEGIIDEEGYLIINAQYTLPAALVGTFSSTLAHTTKPDRYILCAARGPEGVKISARFSGKEPPRSLRAILKDIITDIPGAESGGHDKAAGAIVPLDAEEKVMSRAETILQQSMLEETV